MNLLPHYITAVVVKDMLLQNLINLEWMKKQKIILCSFVIRKLLSYKREKQCLEKTSGVWGLYCMQHLSISDAGNSGSSCNFFSSSERTIVWPFSFSVTGSMPTSMRSSLASECGVYSDDMCMLLIWAAIFSSVISCFAGLKKEIFIK